MTQFLTDEEIIVINSLFESLAQNHVFHNANKRTAFLPLLQFLGYNGHTFVMNQEQAEDFVVDVMNHRYRKAHVQHHGITCRI